MFIKGIFGGKRLGPVKINVVSDCRYGDRE